MNDPFMPLLMKIQNLINISNSEIDILRRLHTRRRVHLDSGITPGWRLGKSSLIILKGWGYTYKHLGNGDRQLIDIVLPGDIAGLRTSLLGIPQGLRTIGQVEAVEIHTRLIPSLFRDWPHLALALVLIANQDSELLAERLVSVGRRPALSRVSHFLLELGTRLEIVGLGTRNCFRCPLTQIDIADALGLSPIHVNRVLRHLRERRVLIFRNGEVEIQDPQNLSSLAQVETIPSSGFFGSSTPLRADLRRR